VGIDFGNENDNFGFLDGFRLKYKNKKFYFLIDEIKGVKVNDKLQ